MARIRTPGTLGALAGVTVHLAAMVAPLAQTVDPAPPAGGGHDAQQCQSLWATLDGNRDGVLTQAEVAAAQDQVPGVLRQRERVTEADFLAACSQPVPPPRQ